MKTIAPAKAKLKERLFTGSILDEEIKLEERAVQDGIVRYRRVVRQANEKGRGADLAPAQRLLGHWFEVYAALIADAVEGYECGEAGTDFKYVGPVLSRLDPEEVAFISMHQALAAILAEPAGERLSRVCNTVGRAIIAHLVHQNMLEENKELFKELARKPEPLSAERINYFARKKGRMPDLGATFEMVRCRLGGFLMRMLINEAGMLGDWMETQSLRPAFEIGRENNGKHCEVTLYLTEEAMALVDDGHTVRAALRPKYLPMIVQPYRITKDSQGQYVKLRPPLYSHPSAAQRKALLKADLTRYWDALSDVASQGWRLNMDIFEVQNRVYKSGGGIANIPLTADVPYPAKPKGYDEELRGKPGVWDDVPEAERTRYEDASRAISKENRMRRSERFTFLRKFGVAEQFRHWPAFYFPHQCDFRGRTYALPLYLNHQADDTARGLLEFSEGKKPGAEGEREMLIEAANCYGMDKLSFDERVQWSMDHEKEIEACWRDPMETTEFWGDPKKCDKPWQFLAACIAIHDRERGSHAPVRPDGTANGVQHYAGISLDHELAKMVNLAPSPRPSDLYDKVAGAVKPLVEEDLRSRQMIEYKAYQPNGRHIVKKIKLGELAAKVLPFVTRKTCKTPAMTDTYGVTLIGAGKQILSAFEELGFKEETRYLASRYLAKKVLDSLIEVCPAAKKLMAYFHYCAGGIARAGHLVRWDTRLGFPVIQPYHSRKMIRVASLMGRFFLHVDDAALRPLVKKHASSCAPNYIHSNDQTHMLMTGAACHTEDIAFAPNHDCYWTHAATKRRMIHHAKAEFVRLYTKDPMPPLAAYWRKEFPGVDIPDPPPRGKFHLPDLMDSEYFFS